MKIDIEILKKTNNIFLAEINTALNEIKNNPNYRTLDSAERGAFSVEEIFKKAAKSLNCTPKKAKQIYLFIKIFQDHLIFKEAKQ